MKVATFQGTVENGQIRLLAGVRLPEKAKVYVVIPDVEIPSFAYIGSPRLAHPEQAADFKKEVIEEIEDAAYDDYFFDPPAPLAKVTPRGQEHDTILPDVSMLLDSGADVTLIPQREIFGNQSRVGYSGAGCAQSRIRCCWTARIDVERPEIIWGLKSRLIKGLRRPARSFQSIVKAGDRHP